MLGEAQTLTGLFRVLQPPDKTKTILRARAHRVRPEVAVGVVSCCCKIPATAQEVETRGASSRKEGGVPTQLSTSSGSPVCWR